MFLVKDCSKENINKENTSLQTLRCCTSEKRIPVCVSENQYIRVGPYKYREKDILGRGYSSRVYKAIHINNCSQRYAIKVINLKKFKVSSLNMLQSQIEVHRSLCHPHIVQFHDAYKTENYYYIITQYCPHGDLSQLLKQKQKIEQSRAQNIIMQIVDGYNYLSKMNILHRDLKPSNIFRKGDMWKIGDFGFSVVCNQEYLVDKINVGTPLYMPPQSLRANKYSYKSDIFSMGIILYQMLTGRTPWQCKTQKQLLIKMKTQQIAYPQLRNQSLKRFIVMACNVIESERLGIRQFISFFSQVANPEQKQNDRKLIQCTSLPKSIRSSMKHLSMGQMKQNIQNQQKQGGVIINKKYPTIPLESSTEVSQESGDSKQLKNNQNWKQRNTKYIMDQLQFCRFIYYMTKNIRYFPIENSKTKSFFCLALFKYLLRSIKQLEEAHVHFGHQLNLFEGYQEEREFKELQKEVKNYSERYENQYLGMLKNTEISVIRAVNRKFPELSYNSLLGEQFYKMYCQYVGEILRMTNHGVSLKDQSQTKATTCEYQAMESLSTYMNIIEMKMRSYETNKCTCFSNFNQKVVMDYRFSLLERKNYISLREKLKIL